MPDRPAIEHREDVGEAQDREQIAQPRTGLGDLQLVAAQIDDVALQEDRHPQQLKEIHAKLRRHPLQVSGHAIIKRGGQRQHVDQMQDRRPELSPRAPAETDQKQRAHPKDQRVGDDVVDGDDAAGDREPERQESQHEARATIRHRTGLDRHPREMAEEQQKRQERDQGAMAVFGQLPGGQERRDPVPEDRTRREHGDDQPEQAGQVGP